MVNKQTARLRCVLVKNTFVYIRLFKGKVWRYMTWVTESITNKLQINELKIKIFLYLSRRVDSREYLAPHSRRCKQLYTGQQIVCIPEPVLGPFIAYISNIRKCLVLPRDRPNYVPNTYFALCSRSVHCPVRRPQRRTTVDDNSNW
jgi:hypothetical protein